jgi:hypothetical protein
MLDLKTPFFLKRRGFLNMPEPAHKLSGTAQTNQHDVHGTIIMNAMYLTRCPRNNIYSSFFI